MTGEMRTLSYRSVSGSHTWGAHGNYTTLVTVFVLRLDNFVNSDDDEYLVRKELTGKVVCRHILKP